MATFTAARAQANITPRALEKAVFCEVTTYTFLGTETAASIINMAKIATPNNVIGIDMYGTTNTASLTLAVADTTAGNTWIPATAATTAAKTSSIIPPKAYAANDVIKVTTAGATATAGATVTLVIWMTQDNITLS